jgi:hypothetical protein
MREEARKSTRDIIAQAREHRETITPETLAQVAANDVILYGIPRIRDAETLKIDTFAEYWRDIGRESQRLSPMYPNDFGTI